MNARRTFALFCTSVVLASGVLAACQKQRAPDEKAAERRATDADRLAELAANSTFDVGGDAQPLVALQLRITAAGATVVRSEFVSAPLPTGSSDQDFTVMGLAEGGVAHKYAIPDPLEAQVESQDRGLHKSVRLPEALVWVYMPAVNLESVQLAPTREADPQGMTALEREGVQIEMRPILQRLCDGPEIAACARRALAAPDRPPPDGGP